MRSFGQVISPQAARWAPLREAERATEARDLIRRGLDDQEAEALATRHAEARRAHRHATEPASADGSHARALP